MDLRTLLFTGFLLQLVCALGMALMARSIRGLAGLRWFAFAYVLTSAAMGLAVLELPNTPEMICETAGALLMGYGIADFAGSKSRLLNLGGGLLAAVGVIYLALRFDWVAPKPGLSLFSVCLAAEMAILVRLLLALPAPGERAAARFTAGLAAAAGILWAGRAVALPLRHLPADIVTVNDPLRFIGVSAYFCFTLGMAFGFIWMITARLREQLEWQAETDRLTGVCNRWALETRAAGEIVRCRRAGEPLSLAVLDLDRFKQINDDYGHPAGDAALVALTEMLREKVREGDTLARFGGEEFILLLPRTTLDAASAMAERLRRAVNQLEIVWNDRRVAFQASFGVATLGGSGDDWRGLMLRADHALYAAKQAGRNCVWRQNGQELESVDEALPASTLTA